MINANSIVLTDKVCGRQLWKQSRAIKDEEILKASLPISGYKSQERYLFSANSPGDNALEMEFDENTRRR